LLVLVGTVEPGRAACLSADAAGLENIDESAVSIAEIIAKLAGDGEPTYLFVGERHQVGAVKRFVVDLANALVERGFDVGLYVEGFQTGCSPDDSTCWSLARAFRADAFHRLLEGSRAPVHPIDPPDRRDRTRRMAEVIAAGSEAVRIVLVGNSHVLHAGDPDAELWVYGGGIRYPDPGDLVEAFPRERTLTFALRRATLGGDVPYLVWADGCAADYSLFTGYSSEY
jgi:hypothetical protein